MQNIYDQIPPLPTYARRITGSVSTTRVAVQMPSANCQIINHGSGLYFGFQKTQVDVCPVLIGASDVGIQASIVLANQMIAQPFTKLSFLGGGWAADVAATSSWPVSSITILMDNGTTRVLIPGETIEDSANGFRVVDFELSPRGLSSGNNFNTTVGARSSVTGGFSAVFELAQ